MAVLAVKPLTLKNVDLMIGAANQSGSEFEFDDFAAHCSSVTFTPAGGTVTWNGLKGNSFTDATVPTWTCTLEYAQDWESDASLSRFLYENEGKHLPVVFSPTSGSGPSFAGTVIVTSGAIGGAVNAVATASVTLGLEARPELVPLASGPITNPTP